MATTNIASSAARRTTRADTAVLLAIVAAVALLHLLTNTRYGFHRDELQFLSDARHLDWGFVAYPPLTPFLEHLGLSLFGVSLIGLRLFSVLAQSTALVITGFMARELGGGRLAQVSATLMVALSLLPLFNATEFQYTSFDFLWWVLIAYFTIRLLNSEDPRWWLAIGLTVGIGLQTKYTVAFLVAGIFAGLLLTSARRYLLTKWFWIASLLALLIFLPNLVWQVRHGFISLHFLQHIHARDVRQGRSHGFLPEQFWICANTFATPVWLLGLFTFLRNPKYRPLAWMYLVPFALFFLGKGRSYYLGAAYPPLLAMGAAAGERWLASLRTLWRRTVEAVFFTGLAVCGLFACALVLPIASSGRLRDFALKNNGDLREEFGWNELARTVADIRDALPPDQRDHAGVLVGNYGEQGAIEILGAKYGLPTPISMTNSAWLRGYPSPPPTTLIVVGFSREDAAETFANCRLAGHNGNPENIPNEESRYHPDIFVCGPPRKPWADFWKEQQAFG